MSTTKDWSAQTHRICPDVDDLAGQRHRAPVPMRKNMQSWPVLSVPPCVIIVVPSWMLRIVASFSETEWNTTTHGQRKKKRGKDTRKNCVHVFREARNIDHTEVRVDVGPAIVWRWFAYSSTCSFEPTQQLHKNYPGRGYLCSRKQSTQSHPPCTCKQNPLLQRRFPLKRESNSS